MVAWASTRLYDCVLEFLGFHVMFWHVRPLIWVAVTLVWSRTKYSEYSHRRGWPMWMAAPSMATGGFDKAWRVHLLQVPVVVSRHVDHVDHWGDGDGWGRIGQPPMRPYSIEKKPSNDHPILGVLYNLDPYLFEEERSLTLFSGLAQPLTASLGVAVSKIRPWTLHEHGWIWLEYGGILNFELCEV